jgi:hypothetical protein
MKSKRTEEQRLRGIQRATRWNKENRERRRKQKCNTPEYLRMNRYGLMPEQYQKMYDEQKGLCKISSCGNPIKFVDHDHDTNEIRALLCKFCNSALGMFRDRPDLMREAAEYVEHFKTHGGIPIVKISVPRKPISEYTRELHRLDMMGNKHAEGHPAWNKGKRWSEETREKMSASAKLRSQTKEGKESLLSASKKGTQVRWGKQENHLGRKLNCAVTANRGLGSDHPRT